MAGERQLGRGKVNDKNEGDRAETRGEEGRRRGGREDREAIVRFRTGARGPAPPGRIKTQQAAPPPLAR